MPGRCSDCGAVCFERADNGKFYCDRCWQEWMDSTEEEKQAWNLKKRKEREEQERSLREAQMQQKAEIRAKELQSREQAYWSARIRARQELREAVLPQVPADDKSPVVFWGICDVKYDPDRPERERVKVLELGDGRSSRFSHHGAVLKQRFDALYCMDVQPLRKGVMVDNKKFTHDTFVDCGLSFLRPLQREYPRRYDPGLAGRIADDFDASLDSILVLKLVNRARGAGVVVCPVAKLDATLQRLLQPPVGRAMKDWLSDIAPQALRAERRWTEVLDEQQLHYWSNESPIFVVEQPCHSLPVQMPRHQPSVSYRGGDAGVSGSGSEGDIADDSAEDSEEGSGLSFDGTMRVAFALRRHSKAEEAGQLELDWLGGYWKLPPLPISSSADQRSDQDSLDEVQSRLVSSFNSEEKRTAPVARDHLLEVYSALEPALVSVFELANLGVRDLAFSYPNDPAFRAFAMVRCGAALRSNGDLSKSSYAFEQARRALISVDANDLAVRSVYSYLERSAGVNHALRGDWIKAGSCFQEAVVRCPTNATAYYLCGVSLQERDRFAEAVDNHLRSAALDPDFRCPLMSLGWCYMQLGLYNEAVEASEQCLRRQPDAPIAQFNIGQAIYQQLRRGHALAAAPEEVQALRKKGEAALKVARSSRPDVWGQAEDEIMRYFEVSPEEAQELALQPLRPWKTFGWRP